MLQTLKKLLGFFTPATLPAAAAEPAKIGVNDNDFRHLSFTFSVIALSARVACLDGPLTQEKYLAFREYFPLQSGICGKIRSLFALACEDRTPYTHYVSQIKHAFPGRQDLFLPLLQRLCHIASAGAEMSDATAQLLLHVAQLLDISAADYAKIHAHNSQARARHVLGIGKHATARTLKTRYLELMRRYHPDRYAAQELSQEVAMLLQLKASEINEAYRYLSKRAA